MSRRTGVPRQVIGDAANGNSLPSATVIAELESALAAGGEVARLWKAAKLEKTRESIDRSLPDMRSDQEEDETNRRTFFEFTAAGFLAADAYRRHSGVKVDPLTLEELDDALARYATRFTTTPHAQLAPEISETWKNAETLLEAGARPRAQAQLTRVAGYSAYYLGRLAFNTGDSTASRRFIRLAAEHAQEIDDPVLTGSVFEMLSTLAFYAHQYKAAADLAHRGFAASGADPYVAARLASNEVRARVALGDEASARAALALMTKHVIVSPPMPGASPFGPANADQTTARTLALLGHGDAAEPLARASVEAYERTGGGFEDRGNATLNLSWALLLRPDPEPEAAAVLTQQVLSTVDVTPTFSVMAKIVDVDRRLDRYAQLPAVRDFRAQLAEHPRLVITQ
ncbi:transcriptional regulator [Frankia sp. KB5]|uniref:transcriptional regulator n=1 Tax=Frankia sp. KB5 TaxID=683318 RepID=UPI001F53DD73|nr:transcriptional regulator [Frankia sp. KB5]